MTRLACGLGLVVLGAVASIGADDPETKRPTISIKALREMDVIGELGIPLGHAAEITATIVSGEMVDNKSFRGVYFLKVETVDGVALKRPLILDFSCAELANNVFKLHKFQTGREASSLSGAQISDLEKDYLGRRVQLAVYESGSFRGHPHSLPHDMQVQQAPHGFRFVPHLEVLKVRDRGLPK